MADRRAGVTQRSALKIPQKPHWERVAKKGRLTHWGVPKDPPVEYSAEQDRGAVLEIQSYSQVTLEDWKSSRELCVLPVAGVGLAAPG